MLVSTVTPANDPQPRRCYARPFASRTCIIISWTRSCTRRFGVPSDEWARRKGRCWRIMLIVLLLSDYYVLWIWFKERGVREHGYRPVMKLRPLLVRRDRACGDGGVVSIDLVIHEWVDNRVILVGHGLFSLAYCTTQSMPRRGRKRDT